jgi:glycosyltransferase involved in cell wall biosynthesis
MELLQMKETTPALQAPFFSIVVPLFNKEATVARAISSVVRQTYTNFEVIVVDDGSDDQSAAVVDAIRDARLSLVRQSNRGVSAARNAGVAVSKADYVCFLDADDEWGPQFLERIAALIDAQPDAGIYCCRYETISPEGDVALGALNLSRDHRGEVDRFFRAYRSSRSLLNSSNVCVRRDALEEIGGFPEGEKVGEDVFVWLTLAQRYRVMFDARISSHIYQNAVNRTIDRLPPTVPYYLRAFLASECRQEMDADLKRLLSSFCLIYAAAAVARGRQDMAAVYGKLLWKVDRLRAFACYAAAVCPPQVVRAVASLRQKRRVRLAVHEHSNPEH